jgi:hypothetical protein
MKTRSVAEHSASTTKKGKKNSGHYITFICSNSDVYLCIAMYIYTQFIYSIRDVNIACSKQLYGASWNFKSIFNTKNFQQTISLFPEHSTLVADTKFSTRQIIEDGSGRPLDNFYMT